MQHISVLLCPLIRKENKLKAPLSLEIVNVALRYMQYLKAVLNKLL